MKDYILESTMGEYIFLAEEIAKKHGIAISNNNKDQLLKIVICMLLIEISSTMQANFEKTEEQDKDG